MENLTPNSRYLLGKDSTSLLARGPVQYLNIY